MNIKDIEELPDSVKAFLAFVIEDDLELSYNVLSSELMKGSKLDTKCNEVLSKVGLTTDAFQGVGTWIEFERLMKAYYPNFKINNFSESGDVNITVVDEESARALGESLAKKMFGDKFDQKIFDEVLKSAIKECSNDWDAVGAYLRRTYKGAVKMNNFTERLRKCFTDNESKWYVDYRDEDGECTESFNSKESAEEFITHNEERVSKHAVEGEKFQLINGPYQN